MTIPSDVRIAAREFLEAMEAGGAGRFRIRHCMGRLLYALGYPIVSEPPESMEACTRAILGLMLVGSMVPPAQWQQLKHVTDVNALHRLVVVLNGRIDVRYDKSLEAARLYAVVLCLARVADGGGSVLVAH